MIEARSIRVVIIEDHAMLAEALADMVSAQPGIAVAAVTGTLQEGVEAVAREQPDVLLLDYRLPDGIAVERIHHMKEAAPGVAVLLITAEPPASVAADAIREGCAGLVPKRDSVQDVVTAIRAVHRGESFYAPELLAQAMNARTEASDSAYNLTQRESEVLRLLSQGSSTAAIAERLVISSHTVRNHVRNLTAKLGARSRLEAVAIARRQGLIEDDRP